MLDILLESINTLLLMTIFIVIMRADKSVEYGRRGWLYIKLGFLLLLFGSFVDITDNFESLNRAIVIGDTPVEAFLEKGVGYLGGYCLVALGLWLWLPTLAETGKIKDELKNLKRNVERQVLQRTAHLEKEVEGLRKSDMALALAEEGRTMLYDNAPVSIAHGLIGGEGVERNMAFAEMLGYGSPEELNDEVEAQGNKFLIWYDPEDIKSLIPRLKTETHINDYETRFRHKDGSIVWARLNFTTLSDRKGNNYYFYCFADNITERKQAADALAESEHRLHVIMESLPAGMYLVNYADHKIVDVNPAALAMTGFDREDLVGLQCCSSICNERSKTCGDFAEGADLETRESLLLKKDGTEFPIIKSVAHFSIAENEYLLTTFVDISEQKRLEQVKEDVNRIVRHDLRSPIIGVINASTLLLMDDTGLDGETRELLEVIRQQGHKVMRMIGMSLAMYKMESGTYEYEPEDMDYMAVVDRIASELSEMARTNNTAINVLLDGEVVEGDTKLHMAGVSLLHDSMLANLLKNAIEASPFGQPVTVSIASGENPVISISNKGAVPHDMRDGFFDKYATSGKPAGTGLGTYSAALIARTMGASIDMETSDEENATTITVTLPSRGD